MTYDVSAIRSRERLPAADDSDQNASAHDFVAAFRFVQSLATELARGRAELPASSVVAEAITQMSREKLCKVTLPYLAGRLRSDETFQPIRDELLRLWERSIRVAAIARVLARHTGACAPDLAMIAGLLHNTGSVYLLARAQRHFLFRKPAIRDVMLNDWQAQLSKTIARNWGLPESIVAAIGDQDTPDREEAGEADLTDVLCVAVIAICYEGRPDELELALAGVASFERLGLSDSRMRAAMAESAVERACLRSAFAG
jgi:hypothetical protein